MKESGKPLSDAMVNLEPHYPGGTGNPSREIETDKNGHFRIRAVAIGPYTVRASTTAHSLKTDGRTGG